MTTRLVKHQKLTKRQIKEDPLVTAAFRGTALWEQYGTRVLIGLGAVALVALLAFFVGRSRAQSEERATGDLFRARMSLAQRDYPTAVQMLKEIVDNAPGTNAARSAMHFLGDAYAVQGKQTDAVTWYRKYLDKVGGNPDAKAAGLHGLAAALEDHGDFQRAATTYGELAKLAINDTDRGRVMLAEGRCYSRAGQSQKAIEIYKAVAQLPVTDQTVRYSAGVAMGELSATSAH